MAFNNFSVYFAAVKKTSIQTMVLRTPATAQTVSDKDDQGQATARTAMMKELEQGFHQVGRIVERFDEHLGTTNRLMESVAASKSVYQRWSPN